MVFTLFYIILLNVQVMVQNAKEIVLLTKPCIYLQGLFTGLHSTARGIKGCTPNAMTFSCASPGDLSAEQQMQIWACFLG